MPSPATASPTPPTPPTSPTSPATPTTPTSPATGSVPPSPTGSRRGPAETSWANALRTAVIATLIVGVILLAFLWPSLTAKPRDLPIAVVGTAQQAAELAAKAPPGALDLVPARDREDAIDAIRHREVYGAIVLGPAPEVLTASGAGPVPTQLLTQLSLQLQVQFQQATIARLQAAQSGPSGSASSSSAPSLPGVVTTDVVPLAAGDPTGVGMSIAGLPLALGGVVGGALISLTIAGTRRRLAAALSYGLIGGLVLGGVLQAWLGVLSGAFRWNALAIGLGMAATAALIAGLHSLVGRGGIAVGAVITVLIGNPLSASTQPKEFLLPPWGDVGQWFVPGASATLLRSLSYFPAADVTGPWLVLTGWFVLGATLIGIGHRAGRRAVRTAVTQRPAVATS